MNPRTSRLTTTSLVVILLIVPPCLWCARQYRQTKINHRLVAAIKHSDVDEVEVLLATGANANTRAAEDGTTPLLQRFMEMLQSRTSDRSEPVIITAVRYGYSDKRLRIIQDLIGAGADVDIRDSRGGTALMMAISVGCPDVAAILVASRADVNAKDYSGSTALMNSSFIGNIETINSLISAHAQVDAKDNEGNTPLITASCIGNTDTIKALIASHADINAKDMQGKSALMCAVKSLDRAEGGIDAVKVLISAGADVNAKDNRGYTPLSMAKGRPGIVALLRKAGAKQ